MLRADGRRSNREIARTLGVPEATVRYRVRRLTESGVLKITASVDPEHLGYALTAVISVHVEPRQLLAAAREMKVHTCIETNGFFAEKLTDEELGTIDLVMLGLKAWNDELHTRLTGRPVEKTLAFARRLAALKKPVWVRFVLVPGLTDDPGDIAQIANFAAGLGNVERVEVLPFHQMGRFKWQQLGIPYSLDSVVEPTVEATQRACDLFRSAGLKAT